MSDANNQPTAPDGPTGQLANWVAGFTLDQAPREVRERAKHLLLDGLGCAVIGARLPWSRVAVDAVLAFEAPGDTPLIGWGAGSGPAAAALLNGTFIQGFELDDVHPQAPLHSNSLLIPALLAALHCSPTVSGEQFLAALIAGYETGPRVGLALHGGEMLTRGWHSGSVFGTVSSAASVANLLGLDPAQTEDALGLGATQSHGLMAAQFGAMSKRMHHGMASRNGLYAAMLARGGYTGIHQVFEQPYGGFLSVFGEGMTPTRARSRASSVSGGRPTGSLSSPTPRWPGSTPRSTPSPRSATSERSTPPRSRASTWSCQRPSTTTAGGLQSDRLPRPARR